MPELETQLRALGEELVWPATPDLAAAVAAAPRRRAPRAAPRARRALAAALAVLLLVPAAAVAFPGARDDVLEWLGLRDVEIRRVPAPPAGHPTRARGRPRPQRHARAGAARGRLRPRAPGRARPARPRPRHRAADLADLRAASGPARARGRRRRADPHRVARRHPRRLPPEAAARRHGRRARQGPRPASARSSPAASTPTSTRPPRARSSEDRPLLAGPTLVWVGGGRVHRLETAAPRATALRIARSVEP